MGKLRTRVVVDLAKSGW